MSGVLDPVQTALLRDLQDPDARDPALSGSKAASLATAHGSGLPVVPGFVITTHVHALFLAQGHSLSREATSRLHEAWARLTGDGQLPVIVRSSSTVEDVGVSSMAGRFRTVLDVRGWEAFLVAVSAVFASADEVSGTSEASPMGVLVQRQVSPSRAGVMFGIDPVSGDPSRIVVEAVSGGPDKLVSGRVTAQHYVLARSGRLVTLDHHPVRGLRHPHDQRRLLDTADLLALARLARRTQRVFGVAQDVEWAFGPDGSLVLLQSRPVTATGVVAPAGGPVLGPGPLAETFPDPLGELEVDLWIRPLRDAVVDAMTETRSVSRRRLASSPVVTVVGGRVAADLELFGYVHSRSALGVFDPRPAARQLAAAWRVGVLRAELPARAAALVNEVDASLMAIDPGTTSDRGLLDLLQQGAELLRQLHHAEVLAGTLLPSPSTTAAALALQILPDLPDLPEAVLIRRHPILLCLVPPSLTDALALPPAPASRRKAPAGQLGPREQLRLRVRWTQEMTVRVVRELARRLARRGRLADVGSVGMLHLDELREVVGSERPVAGVHERRAAELSAAFGPPLPAQFRLTADAAVVPVSRPGARPSSSGVPAGGGRGVGPVCHGSVRHPPSPGDVLVVRDLQPGLAASLPGLAGLIAETGGTLSHLAILAREYGVPTVVAVQDALHRFQPGTRLLIDGATGEIRVVDRGQEP